MSDILQKIMAHKFEELEHYKRQEPFEELKAKIQDRPDTQDFVAALRMPPAPFAIIAEIKRRSPSKGLLREDFDPVRHATNYAAAGASALSVLTDEHFFGGHLDHLRSVRSEVKLPLLRKDFIWDPYQVYAAREAGADAILLIASVLEQNQMEDLSGLARDLGLATLPEVYALEEVAKCLPWSPELLGVNNRNLKTFDVDLSTSERVFAIIPDGILKVSESGIGSRADLERLSQKGAQAFLIGERFMKAEEPGRALAQMMGEGA